MKRLLFLSLLLSIPAWGMEEQSEEAGERLYLHINKKKKGIFKHLLAKEKKANVVTTMEGSERFIDGLKALDELDQAIIDYKPSNYIPDAEEGWRIASLDYKPSPRGIWSYFFIAYKTSGEGYKGWRNPDFKYAHFKPILERLPYVKKVVTEKEMEKIHIQELLEDLNATDEE